MGGHNIIHHSVEFFFLRLVYDVLVVNTDHRLVGGDGHGIHAVGIPELFLLRQSGTGHTGLLAELVEEVLERDSRQSFALPFYLNMLLRLNGLVQTVGVAPARHDTACKLIHDKHFIVLHHIVLVPEHEVIGPQSQNDVVLDLQVLRIRQVLNMEEFLHFLHALLSQVDDLVLLIDDKVPCLLDLLAHDGADLGKFS